MDIEHSIQAAYVARSALALLRPYDVLDTRMVRVGRPFDGGYLMIDAFEGVEAAYSLGINDDVSWDLDIANRGIDIYQYDHTIDGLPVQHPRFHWFKTGIAGSSGDGMQSLPDIVKANGHQDARNMILKCDIECAEWETLQNTPQEVLSKFSQIVIEMHDIYRLGDHNDLAVHQALINLTNLHRVVHVHANNYGGVRVVGGIPLPNVIEVTLLRKDVGEFQPSTRTFPTPMDIPCNGDAADIYLGTFTYS